jgi:hypothetical protein
VKIAGITVLVATVLLSGLLLVLWFVGLIGGVGGNLIHLLLILAIMVVPIGVAAGVGLIVFSARQAGRTQ